MHKPSLPGRVDFIVCGVQKAGTTAMYNYLRLHPDICMADRKETHFFNTDNYFITDDVNYDDYHSQFSALFSGKQIGEMTPVYSYWRPAMKRIQKYNPRMKLILLLRNPVDRAYSHWTMEFARGKETLPFDLAIEKETERGCLKFPHQAQHLVYSYLDRGNYPTQIERIWRFFSHGSGSDTEQR